MDFFEALYGFLTNSSVISNVFENRVFPLVSGQGSIFPVIVYSPIGASYDKNLQGESGLVRQRVQLSIFDNTFAKSRTNSRKVKALFKDFKGNMNGLNIQATHTLTYIVTYLDNSVSFNVNVYCSILELEFIYEEQA